MSNTQERNYEWRSIEEVPGIEVTRDGEVRYSGRPRFDSRGNSIIMPSSFEATSGERLSLQMMIFRAFPDIPMRYTPTW